MYIYIYIYICIHHYRSIIVSCCTQCFCWVLYNPQIHVSHAALSKIIHFPSIWGLFRGSRPHAYARTHATRTHVYIYIYIYIYIHTYIHTLHYIFLHYIALHYNTLHCNNLHYNTLHCNTLYYITLHCNTLHYIHNTYIHTYLPTYIHTYIVHIYMYIYIKNSLIYICYLFIYVIYLFMYLFIIMYLYIYIVFKTHTLHNMSRYFSKYLHEIIIEAIFYIPTFPISSSAKGHGQWRSRIRRVTGRGTARCDTFTGLKQWHNHQ